jgi:hypothetical protein
MVILQIFENSRRYSQFKCTTSINYTDGKFATGAAGVVDPDGKFAAGVNYPGGKFATSINNTGGKISTGIAGVVDTGGKFTNDLNDTRGNLPPVSTTWM